MKTLKKMLLTTLCATCAVCAGAATAEWNDTNVASAAVATEYTTVETAMMMKLENVYQGNGNFNIYVTLPEYDTNIVQDNVVFTDVDLASVFDNFGFFDSVKIGEKSLRELGCTGFYSGYQMAFGVGEPKNVVKLYLHADPETWMAAYNAGEVVFGDNQTDVTITEGTIIPGYKYLMGEANATVYKADKTYVSERITDLTYSYYTTAQTQIDGVRYVQPYDAEYNCGYLGVSLVGDDYASNGQQKEFLPNYRYTYEGNLIANSFTKKILVNGQAGKVEAYALVNLGERGKGYLSFVIRVPEEEVETITIPKGTCFPSYLMDTFRQINNGNYVHFGYATTEDVTLFKTTSGDFVVFEGYADKKSAELTAYRATKTEADYFANDLTQMDAWVESALVGLSQATNIAEVDEAFDTAKNFIDSIEPKTVVIANAKAELNDYKTDIFRAEETAQREAIVETAFTAIEDALNKSMVENAVATAKTQIDGLKTAAQYADEELAVEKAAANAEINGYRADVAYLAEQAAERATAVEAGLQAVANATNSEEIAQAVADVKTAVDVLTTKATIVDAAKAELSAYNADKIYREAEAAARAAAISTANTALDNAVNQADVDNAVATAIAAIDALKTDVQLTEEEKAAADALFGEEKAIALAKINEYKAGIAYDDYTAENQAVINELYRAAKQAVEYALTEEAIREAVETFKTGLAAVPKIGGTDNNPNDSALPDVVTSDEEKSGCKSSVGLASLAILTALGGVLLHKKKED